MNKTELNEKWGKYSNTDKLVDDMMALLTQYEHRNTEHGVCVVLDKYFEAKKPLIKKLATSNHYRGDMRVIVQKDFDRDIDRVAVYNFCNNFSKEINAEKALLVFEDADGKKVSDYILTGHRKVNMQSFDAKKYPAEKMSAFDLGNCATKVSSDKYDAFNGYMRNYFARMACAQIPRDYTENGIEIKKGMKTSRAFNKVCTHYGINKANPKKVIETRNGQTTTRTVYPYDQLFAEYADLVSAASRKLYYIISVNPLDYLTMSFGVNWQSCQSIRGYRGRGGMACNGCMSYMMDDTSIITFVTDNIDGDIHNIGKIYRQMYYTDSDMFINSRVYPQANDGATNLYDKFLGLFTEEMAEVLDIEENDWVRMPGHGTVNDMSRNIGTHYPDAGHNEDCGVYYSKSKVTSPRLHKKIVIGAHSYCPHCGREYVGARNRLSHDDCNI